MLFTFEYCPDSICNMLPSAFFYHQHCCQPLQHRRTLLKLYSGQDLKPKVIYKLGHLVVSLKLNITQV